MKKFIRIKNKAIRNLIQQGFNPSPAYYNWHARREKINAQISEEGKEKIEMAIMKKWKAICEDAIKNKRWFSIEKIMTIPEIKEHFECIMIISQRGIGKSWSLRKFMDTVVKKKWGSFIILRSSVKAKDRQIDNFKENWFAKNEWYCLKSTGQIFRNKESLDRYLNRNQGLKAKTIKERPRFVKETVEDGVIGYVESLKQNYDTRSIDKPSAKWLIYEEFAEWPYKTSQIDSYVDYFESVVRNKPGFKHIFFANYTDIENEILKHLGVKPDDINLESIRFNWFAGAAIFHVEEGIFRQETDHFTASQKFAVASQSTYLRQQGASYEQNDNFQLVDEINGIDENIKPMYHIKIDNVSFNVFKNGDKYLVADNNFINLAKNEKITDLVLFRKDHMIYPEFKLAPLEFSKKLCQLQLARRLEYNSAFINRKFREALDIIQKIKTTENGSFLEKI